MCFSCHSQTSLIDSKGNGFDSWDRPCAGYITCRDVGVSQPLYPIAADLEKLVSELGCSAPICHQATRDAHEVSDCGTAFHVWWASGDSRFFAQFLLQPWWKMCGSHLLPMGRTFFIRQCSGVVAQQVAASHHHRGFQNLQMYPSQPQRVWAERTKYGSNLALEQRYCKQVRSPAEFR